MDLTLAETLIKPRNQGVLVTLRRSGRPQISNVVYTYDGGIARVSVTATRAKTANIRRDSRCTLYVPSDTFWEYVVADGEATLSEVTTSPGDAAGLELLEVWEKVTGDKHPDPGEFHEAMVADQRQVVRLAIDHVYGQYNG
jgi:PPOX class probable F420-dependent enzyme